MAISYSEKDSEVVSGPVRVTVVKPSTAGVKLGRKWCPHYNDRNERRNSSVNR